MKLLITSLRSNLNLNNCKSNIILALLLLYLDPLWKMRVVTICDVEIETIETSVSICGLKESDKGKWSINSSSLQLNTLDSHDKLSWSILDIVLC